MKTLREDQLEAVEAILKRRVGQIHAPTGSGKSLIALEAFNQIPRLGSPNLFVVLVPRIILGGQWIREAVEYLNIQHGRNFNYIAVNSGHISRRAQRKLHLAMREAKQRHIDMIASTNANEVASTVRRMMNSDQDVIIVSTYHSYHVVRNALRILDRPLDMAFDDEAHLIGGNKDWREEVPSLPAIRRIFASATPSDSPDSVNGFGMNNINRYGPVIHRLAPVDAIQRGIIVPPHLFIVEPTDMARLMKGDISSDNDLLPVIARGYEDHAEHLANISADPSQVGAKMLVVHDGIGSIQSIFKSKEYRRTRRDMRAKCFAINSHNEFKGYIDGDLDDQGRPVNKVSKEAFLDEIDTLDLSERCTIHHVDMLAEGVDCPGITAVMFFRNCSQTKALQNIGRSTRIHPIDRQRIMDGKLQPGDFANYIKPCASILLPWTQENGSDFVADYRELLTELRNNWGFDPRLHLHLDYKHPTSSPQIELGEKEQRRRSIVHEIEDLYTRMDEQVRQNNLDDLIFATTEEREILELMALANEDRK